MDRRGFARRSYWLLEALGFSLAIAMMLWSRLSGDAPSNRWLLPLGCLAMVSGLHLIYFRSENSEYFSGMEARWGFGPPPQSPGFMVLYGAVLLAICLVFLSGGVSR